MRLPLPLLLYVTALGLFAWAGWTVYDSLPLWQRKNRDLASSRGNETALKLLARGKGGGQKTADWDYSSPWWRQFKQFSAKEPQGVNLIGLVPKVEPTPDEIAAQQAPVEPPVDMTPLEDIFELVTLVYDGNAAGKGGNTHVIIRYKPDAAVEPPEWWLRENTPPDGAGGMRIAGDVVNVARNPRNPRTNGPATQQPSPMPGSSLAGREILQKIWVDDGGDERRSANLWPNYAHIRLVRVGSDAETAYFVRDVPQKPGEPDVEPQEEPLLKTTMNLSQDVLREVRRLQGRDDAKAETAQPVAQGNTWREVEETTRFGNEFHIGRKDEQRFRDSSDLFDNVYVDTYVSKSSSRTGLSVRSVKPQLAQTFGINQGDVLLEINSRTISSKAQAVNMVKRDYRNGVRTFNTKWMSNGQIVERTYQAPDR